MKVVLVTTLFVGLGLSGHALAKGNANASAKLAEEKQCMQCHAVDKDTIGPSFKKIKTLYKGTKGAEAKLVAIIRQGSDATGGPHWGAAKMPDNSERPLVSEKEAKKLARWILS